MVQSLSRRFYGGREDMSDWENALDYFCKRAKENNIDFYLVGSSTASVRGVNIVPHDIDVIVDISDFWKAKDVFNDIIIKPFSECLEDSPVSYFGKIHVNGFIIDISAKPQNIYGRHKIEMLCWNGYILKSQTLELLLMVYRNNNRHEYIKAIDDYLESFTV